ncbi:pilus (MSHA type) biogenesis protein MshL [Sulfurovum sp. NBC37-1]|uniref:pilus (MSHA type) biogenesis protein MshL n=1 Tax=Sulfurovum sp. (strain NBC37-1) TaxID=387093 RepID=UPI0001587D61|nr:pilus (MSHA type) biogenesis protein MshL [Sulfurovum sp. NBC37-1]BAF72625.1 general secretory pathway protein D [Sulfurovum sp. NBC37-1]
MKIIEKSGMKFIIVCVMYIGLTQLIQAGSCSTKLFSVTIDSKLTIGDVIENLAETCDLTVSVKDDAAKKRMNKKLYYVKLKNSTLKGFLNTILKDNDLYYTLKGNKLAISYLITRTFKIHYISGKRIGKSNANVTIANASNSLNQNGADSTSNNNSSGNGSLTRTGMSIESNDEFRFWQTVQNEIQRILIGAGDGSTHYTKTGESWTGPDGQVWEYNPLEPIVNPEAGMVTVTGTARQINRVARYINVLSRQIKTQVLIDVRILAVKFDDSRTTGVDWSQLYGLQNFAVDSLIMAQKNVASYTFDKLNGIQDTAFGPDTQPRNGSLVQLTGKANINEVVKFLATQGDVKAISSPRVMTLNNQPAMISVGKELFYKLKSTSALGTGNNANTAQGESVDSVFAGILLDITPEIGNNGIITLKINPSISETIEDIQTQKNTVTGSRDMPPDLIRRQIASVVKVKDGEHAILGGLITSSTGTKVNKIPLLGDIPLLEYAFKHEEKINRVEELVLIITPHIVKTSKSVTLKDLGYTKLNEK